MRRWWIINFASDDQPYQINLLGLVVGAPLGLLGGVLGFAVGGQPDADLVRLGVAGCLLILPAAAAHSVFSEMIFGTPLDSVFHKIFMALMYCALGAGLAIALRTRVDLTSTTPWLVTGGISGLLLGGMTQQYEYRRKKKRKRRQEFEFPLGAVLAIVGVVAGAGIVAAVIMFMRDDGTEPPAPPAFVEQPPTVQPEPPQIVEQAPPMPPLAQAPPMPEPQIEPEVKQPPAKPDRSKPRLARFKVRSARPLTEIEGRVRDELGKVNGIDAGSITIGDSEIHLRYTPGMSFAPIHAAFRRLGMQVTTTETNIVP